MPIRTNGGVFDQQILTGSLSHWVICGADFSGAVNSYGKPVPNSAAEIIFRNIEEHATIDIMNPNDCNLSFALEEGRSIWDEISLTVMVQSLGTDVGVDHINCAVCTVKQVPYVWGCGTGGATTFLDLTDTPDTYAGAANYVVTVNPTATGLIFTAVGITSNAYSFVAVPTQTTLAAIGSDTLTIKPGANVNITTDPLTQSLTISSTAGTDYVPVPQGTLLAFSTKYFVTSTGTVFLPHGTGSGRPAGTSVVVTKPNSFTVYVTTTGPFDIISTDLGSDTTIEFDATQECIFVFDGTSTWNLQIGSTL
jgi:hypothetical protein